MKKPIQDIFSTWVKDGGDSFSGVFSASGVEGTIFDSSKLTGTEIEQKSFLMSLIQHLVLPLALNYLPDLQYANL